jgi:hypothetical protein
VPTYSTSGAITPTLRLETTTVAGGIPWGLLSCAKVTEIHEKQRQKTKIPLLKFADILSTFTLKEKVHR